MLRQKYSIENINNGITTFGFVLFLIGMFSLCILIPDKQISENENRALQPLPRLTVENVLNGSYMKEFENYSSDHIIGRDRWVAFKNNMDISSGKKDNGSVYYGKAGTLFAIESVDYAQLEKNIQYTKDFLTLARQENPTIRLSVLLAPTSTEVMSNKLPPNAPVINQENILHQVKDGLKEVTVEPQNKENADYTNAVVNVLPDLKSKRDEYVYYRTDHHWTTLGAYYAYKAWEEQNGINPHQLEDFDVKKVSNDFYGTTYSKAVSEGILPDTIERFDLKGQKDCTMEVTLQGKTRTLQGLYEDSYLDKKDKYSYFLSGNNAITTIDTGVKNGKKILIVKDSYAHCFIPFLTEEYETIVAVDMRYYKENPANLIKQKKITDLLILYNIIQYTDDRNMVYLSKM